MPSNPEKYNVYRTDEIMREAACKAAFVAIHILETQVISQNDYQSLSSLGTFIHGCSEAMFWPEDGGGNGEPNFDDD